MSLSISSFSSERKIAAILALELILVELFIFFYQDRLSGDIRNIKAIPEESRRLASFDGIKLVFLGNSMIHDGVDLDVFNEEASKAGGTRVRAIKVNPDGTTIAEWYYLFKKQFIWTGRVPDVLVVGFEDDYASDSRPASAVHLGSMDVSIEDVPEAMRDEVRSFDERVKFILSWLLLSYANNESIHRRALDMVVPNYREGRLKQRDLNEPPESDDAPALDYSYSRLMKFIQVLKENDIKMILVAMPVKQDYRLDDELENILEREGITLIDMREYNGLDDDMFKDGQHLNEEGARLFTSVLSRKLMKEIKEKPEKPDTR